jgi:hypothetical protein
VRYAIDLGVEVDPQSGAGSQTITSIKAVKGVVTTKTRLLDEKKYRLVNRGQIDRTLVIEHANRTKQLFKLVDTDKPVEEAADVYRFQTSLKAGEARTFTVKEEKELGTSITLTNNSNEQIHYFLKLPEISAALKQKLTYALALKTRWDGVQRELSQTNADITRLNADQDRIRKNLRETPREAEVYATYLKKLSAQEAEIDALTEQQKKLMSEEFAARKRYEEYLANLTE